MCTVTELPTNLFRVSHCCSITRCPSTPDASRARCNLLKPPLPDRLHSIIPQALACAIPDASAFQATMNLLSASLLHLYSVHVNSSLFPFALLGHGWQPLSFYHTLGFAFRACALFLALT
mmetsp:Transcript_97861/g.188859  ORF Transcript_97861/g.188859 Transcript_97861/m.188859 type:complete len:120 (+) Transcript_97861:385-744(+)